MSQCVRNTKVCNYDCFGDFPREIRGGVKACAGARVARRRAQEPGTCSLFQQFDIFFF
jgi:hypothetical protein